MKPAEFLVEHRLPIYEQKTYKLWESAGRKLVEAQLTADQIKELFTQIEQGATAAGANRTMLGKGKDAASAVNKAWEDLKTKIQNSGPIKNVDAMYDQAAEKLKQATGGDQGVMKYVQKYRDFAKKHPIAQSLIYSALIAAAGISGAGLGGAAALGLFKMVDKLLQGEKFSSAAYSGAKTGAMAFAASKLGDYVKGLTKGDQIPPLPNEKLPPGVPKMDFENTDYYVGSNNMVVSVPKGAPNPFTGENPSGAAQAAFGGNPNDAVTPWGTFSDQELMRQTAQNKLASASGSVPSMSGSGIAQKAADAASGVEMPADAATDVAGTAATGGGIDYSKPGPVSTNSLGQKLEYGIPVNDQGAFKAPDRAAWDAGNMTDAEYSKELEAYKQWRQDYLRRWPNATWNPDGSVKANLKTGLASMMPKLPKFKTDESIDLNEATIRLVFSKVELQHTKQLTEGILDTIKGAASRAAGAVKQFGTNLTTKITADKLSKAWEKAGKPTDSAEISKILTGAGVPQEIITSVFTSMKIPADTQAQPAAAAQQPAAAPAAQAKPAAAQPAAKPGAAPAAPAQAPAKPGVNPELQKRLAQRKAGQAAYAGNLEEELSNEGQIYSTGGGAGQSYRKFRPKTDEKMVNANDGDGWRWYEPKLDEEQLDELKCWPGYTRVKGVPAGAPGSCKKKTKESSIMKGITNERK